MDRLIVNVTLAQLDSLRFFGIDVYPNAHAWVSDESIQAALDAGYWEDTRIPHTAKTNRAGRTACYVRMIDEDILPRRFYADMYFRGTALRFKLKDGNTRWRAMQFRRDGRPVDIHVFGQHDLLRDALPASCFTRRNAEAA